MNQNFKLSILAAIFVAGLIAANLVGSKITTILGISVSVGIFAYPLTFMITDVIGEVLGKKRAKQVVWAALIAQSLVLIFTYLAIKMPPAGRYELNEEYIKIFQGSIRMTIAIGIHLTKHEDYQGFVDIQFIEDTHVVK